MKEIKSITTGYSRGYVRVAERFNETDVNIKEALKAHKNSNLYQCVKSLINSGATKITVSCSQHSNSSQYMYYIYKGYTEA